MIIKLTPDHMSSIIACLCAPKGEKHLDAIVQMHDISHPLSYFENGWLGYGEFVRINSPIKPDSMLLVSYCFIKNPTNRPETLTVTREGWKSMGYAGMVRDHAIASREFDGHIVYSQVELTNPASFKSVIKSGFAVYDVTKDNHVQLVKVLSS